MTVVTRPVGTFHCIPMGLYIDFLSKEVDWIAGQVVPAEFAGKSPLDSESYATTQYSPRCRCRCPRNQPELAQLQSRVPHQARWQKGRGETEKENHYIWRILVVGLVRN